MALIIVYYALVMTKTDQVLLNRIRPSKSITLH